jgi:hypothetical protein
MTEEKAKKRRARRVTEIVDFSDCQEVRDWLQVRAKANHRNISQEITYRLSAAKRSAESGAKNLKHN